MATYTPNAADSSKPFDSDDPSVGAAEFRALKARVNQLVGLAALPVAATLNQSSLTNLLYPSQDGQWRDIYRGGWRPALFNQQWGGSHAGYELVDGATDTVYKFDATTGYIEDKNIVNLANGAAATYVSQGLLVGEAQSIAAIWIKLNKVGNPSNNLTLSIVADDGTTTKPLNTVPITNGTATVQSGRVHTSGFSEWYRFVFPAAPALAANTTYHILLKSSGAVDAVNYWTPHSTTGKTYMNGNLCLGDATPTFTVFSAIAMCFLVESTTLTQFLQPGGQFEWQLRFMDSATFNTSKALIQPLRNFFDGKSFTALHRVGSCQKAKPIADYLYGLDHDRISLQCNAVTGFPSVNFYDAASNLVTITGAVDVSAGGINDIAILGRFVGDGADYIQLWVNGILQAQTTLGTYVIDPAMRELGHCWLGGGFPLCPAWTQKLDMSVLPSAAGWTWIGTGVELGCMSIQNGKLRQSKTGYASTDTGQYVKAAAGFNNTAGGSMIVKMRVLFSPNTISNPVCQASMQDGTKADTVGLEEIFVQRADTGAWKESFQQDIRTYDNVILVTGVTTNTWVFLNGRLVIDASKLNTAGGAANSVQFGDNNSGAGQNADAVWDYVAYYNTAAIIPQFSTGMFLHEYAHWSGNRSALLPTLWNAGFPISVKALTGGVFNYSTEVTWSEDRIGLTTSPTTTSTSYAIVPDLEIFYFGDRADITYQDNLNNTAAGAVLQMTTSVDGRVSVEGCYSNTPVAGYSLSATTYNPVKTYMGLHKVEAKWVTTSGTMSSVGMLRHLTARSVK